VDGRDATRSSVALLLAVLLALLGGAEPRPSRAQSAAEPEARTPAEAEALELLRDDRLVSARTKAERLLRANPDSIVGHYVLGRAFFDAEGSLARAMYHLGRARELFESGAPPPSEFHQELLFHIARLAGQMELHEYQLEVLGYHDHLYDPDLVAERCWPLLKLGRTNEARELAQLSAGSPNPWQRSAGLNALCAVEGEARTRTPYFQACERALADARAAAASSPNEEGGGLAVDAYNAALAATAALRFPQAEELALEGVRRFEPTPANPWRFLVELRVSSGRMREAIEAFEQMLRWNDRQPAALRDQSRAENEALVALVLVLAGESEQALSHIDRALERPDRRGLTTDGAEQARGRNALLRRVIRRALLEQRAEEASWRGRGAQLAEAGSALPEHLRAWPDDERIVAVMADGGRLVDSLRPYVPGGVVSLSPWLAGELIDVLGPAVVAVALREAKRLDAEEPATEAAYVALEAELAAARGDTDDAVRLARDALGRLEGPGWAMLRARTAAVVAAAAEADGDEPTANELFGVAMEADPGVIRRLGLSLPTRIEHTGGDAADAAELLSRSPRFSEREGGFVLSVTDTGAGLRACVRTPTNNELLCAEVPRELPPGPARARGADSAAEATGDEEDAVSEDDQEPAEPAGVAERMAAELHRQLFSARVALANVDLRSLDGNTRGGSSLANERLRELVGPEAAR
jgi:tetratricopeptide (TPR) repeat protein